MSLGPTPAGSTRVTETGSGKHSVLRYYKLQDEATLQCDASQHGLGAARMQNGQPIAYASRGLKPAETRYAQIEKELLNIVYACDHFEPYIFGRKSVNVETDHQPLETVHLSGYTGCCSSYRSTVWWSATREENMFLADTLSRAHLPEVQAMGWL